MIVKIIKIKCKRCGHQWIPKLLDVRECPKCQSNRWDEEPNKKRIMQ